MSRPPSDYSELQKMHAAPEPPPRTAEMDQRLMARPQPESAQLQAQLLDQGMASQQHTMHEVSKENNARVAAVANLNQHIEKQTEAPAKDRAAAVAALEQHVREGPQDRSAEVQRNSPGLDR